MRFAFSLKHLVLLVIVGVTAKLVLMPSCARAMVGDVPPMPQTEQTTTVTTSSSPPGGSTSSTPPGSGGPGTPATTPEPPALLSGLLGLGLLFGYQAVCRALHSGTVAHRSRGSMGFHHIA